MTLETAFSDRTLCERAVAGDQEAFASIIRLYKTKVFSFVQRYVGNSDDAHDLMQQVFISAWQSLASFDSNRPMAPWLTAIALNKCRDHSRKAKVRQFLQMAWPINAVDVADTAPTADELMNDDQELQLLEKAISQLPRGLKEPLLLTAFEALSHKEAGVMLGLSAKAIEGRSRRARQELERKIKQWMKNPIE